MRSLAMIAAIGIGLLIAVQPAVNAETARRLGSPYVAALFSLALSTAILLPLALGQAERPSLSTFQSLPLWGVLGGLAGACFVTGGILIVPAIGAALFVLCVVFGQALGASLADHFGLFGLAQKALDPWKIGGLALMVVGLLVYQRGGT